MDWLYATDELAHRCTRLRVDHTVLGTLSDHAPLIAEFRVPPLDGSNVVDPDSFVEELCARAGPKCARIAKELIAWAGRKHFELESRGRRAAYFNRMPTRNADPPEIWFQRDRLPSADGKGLLQWTFSIKADGRVVVQFRWMAAPYTKDNAREELWSELCRIEGLSLHKRLKGQPTLPLKKTLHNLNTASSSSRCSPT